MPHKEINTYYRMVRRCLPGSGKEKKRILESIRRSVDEYLEENPHADMQTIQAHFGTPRQIADAYVEQMDTTDVSKQLNVKKVLIIAVCGALVLGLLMWGIGLLVALINEHESDTGYGVYGSVVEIETEETQ